LTASGKPDFDHIFRAYDIRGIFSKDLTEEVAAKIGAAFATFLDGRTVIVGRDVRLSGEKLRNALVSGLVSRCNVTDVGVVPTPLVYFALNRLQKDAGIMVTASHNPPQWNGFKAFRGQKGSIYGKDMEKIKQLANDIDLEKLGEKRGSSVSYAGIIEEYQEFVQSKIQLERKLNVVADTANATCGLVAPSLFERLGCNILTLNQKPDGTFPAHPPVPKEETLGELMKEVVRNKADFGVGYDGDGDRAVFIDEKGNLIPGDLTLLIFAKDVLQKHRGGKVVYELSCSMAVEEYVKKLGGIPLVERVGHTFIIDEKLSEMVASLPQYPSVYEKNFECADNLKFAVIEKLRSRFKNIGLKTLDIDGVKLIEDEGWVILRASNTEPVVRISAEARTEEKLKELYDFAVKELNKVMKGD